MATAKKNNHRYTVKEVEGVDDAFLIHKLSLTGGDGDQYTVLFTGDPDDLSEDEVHCSCMGFRMQKYDKRKHKHVLLVLFHRLATIANPGRKECLYMLNLNNQPYAIPMREEADTRG